MNLTWNRALGALVLAVLCSGTAAADIVSSVVRKNVAGIDFVVCRTGVKDVITLSAALPAGTAMSAGGNPAAAALTGMMLDKGTRTQDQFRIAEQLEGAGAELQFNTSNQLLTARGRMLRKDLPLLIGLLAEQLRTPALSKAELDKARAQFTGNLQQALQDTETMAREQFALAVYPQGHPNRPIPMRELLAAAPRVSVADLRAFHARYYGPAQMRLVLVGDVDAQEAEALVKQAFNGWTGGAEPVRATAPAKAGAAQSLKVSVPGKASVNLLIGQAIGIDAHHADAIALQVGTAILGSGFTGRLMASVRDREGLTYGIGSAVGDDMFNDGSWSIYATFAPDLLEQGITSTRRELQTWWQKGVTAEELNAHKSNLVGAYKVRLASSRGIAEALLSAVVTGRDINWLDEYPKRVEALTLEQVNGVLRQRLDPARMVTVTAGPG